MRIRLPLLAIGVGLAACAAAEAPASRPSPRPAPTKPAPPRPAVSILEGIVKGPDAKPIGGAVVTASGVLWERGIPPVRALTGADGKFRLEARGAGPFTLRFEAKGRAGRKLERVRPGPPLTVVLDTGGAVEGGVRDAETGAPVAGARVSLATGPEVSWTPEAGVVTATTDAKGRFRLDGVGRSLYELSVRARGYAAASVPAVTSGRHVDVLLLRGATLSGSVLGPRGEAVSGAVVRVALEERRWGPQGTGVVTDRDGRYELAGIEPGAYVVMASHESFGPGMTPGVVVTPLADVQADVRLGTGVRVTGRIVDEKGAAVSGQVAVESLADAPVPEALSELLHAVAGGDGRFVLERVSSGAYRLRVSARGRATRPLDVEVAAQPVDLGDVVLESGLVLTGRVHAPDGRPIADARVIGFSPRTTRGSMAESVTEADGSFVLGGLSEGEYSLRVTAGGYGSTMLKAETGSHVDVVLQIGGAITGTAIDDAGRPIGAYQAEAHHDSEFSEFSFSVPPTAVESIDGRFAIENLTPGTYVVELTAPNRAPGVVSAVRVTAGASADVGSVRLPAGGVLRGVVVDTHDVAVAGAVVAVATPPGSHLDVPVQSDMSGRFELRGAGPGTVTVMARHPNFAPTRMEGIEVDPEKGPTDVRLVLRIGARIEGYARRKDQTGIPNSSVVVQPQGRRMSFRPEEGVRVAADGSFALEHVPPGPSDVALLQRGASRLNSVQHKSVDLREGETTTVEFRSREILMSGHVSRGGAAASGYRIRLRGRGQGVRALVLAAEDGAAQGPQRLFGTTGDDGRYELLVDEPGPYDVLVVSADGTLILPARQIEVPDAEAYSADFDYTGAPLTGTVVDARTDAPVPGASLEVDGDDVHVRGSAGSDGRFRFELEPGRYLLSARAEDHARIEVTVDLGPSGEDRRMRLPRGQALRGRFVDARGRPIPNATILAMDPGANQVEWTQTMADGSFKYPPLAGRSFAICGASPAGGFAVRVGVTPGSADDLALTARPAAHLHLVVRGADGAPLAGAMARLDTVDGSGVACSNDMKRSDTQGLLDVALPPGAIGIIVFKERLTKTLSLSLREGETLPAEITLSAEKP